jgi:hypothetical protein
MGEFEETLGHDLQIGCQRYRRTIDVDVDHHSTPSAFHTDDRRYNDVIRRVHDADWAVCRPGGEGYAAPCADSGNG